jgi:hypothetical protein
MSGTPICLEKGWRPRTVLRDKRGQLEEWRKSGDRGLVLPPVMV